MAYILDQRLHSQSIEKEKSSKVMTDIIQSLLNPGDIDRYFKPQEIYSMSKLRAVFDKLAHCSTMRLNTSSMDKLFDLMVIGFKYQIMQCRTANELFNVTLNHLVSIRGLVDPGTHARVDTAIERFESVYGGLRVGSWNLIRQTLLHNFQDKRIKASIFLSEGKQNSDSSMVVDIGPLGPGFRVPGCVRFFSREGREVQVEHVRLPLSSVCTPHSPDEFIRVGLNLYSREGAAASSAANPSRPTTAEADEARHARDPFTFFEEVSCDTCGERVCKIYSEDADHCSVSFNFLRFLFVRSQQTD